MAIQKIIGRSYKLPSHTVFKVLATEFFPPDKVGKPYKQILSIKEGLLVAISFRGTLIPNITLSEGVMRLTKVEVSGKTYDTPKAISEALEIREAMIPHGIERV